MDVEIHDLLRKRWSPVGFAPVAVDDAVKRTLLEAARWAPSSFNEQPWAFVVAGREDRAGFERLLQCLVPGNQAWAGRAPVLALSIAKLRFDRTGRDNRHAFHDVGLAAATLVLQAEALGLSVHQMAGFDVERARSLLRIPEGHDPVAMMAIGYHGDPASLSEELRRRELAPRTRRPLGEIVFGGIWGEPSFGRLDSASSETPPAWPL